LKVVLIRHTPDPERLCAQAALVSKFPKAWSEFIEFWNDETDMVHLTDAIEKGHISVIEHASFTFSLEGISRSCSHQVVRYRIASFTQQSQRYVFFRDPKTFVIPETISKNEKTRVLFNQLTRKCYSIYQKLVECGIPQEDARFVMPNATKTNLVVTMNARELLHLFAQRCCNRAQKQDLLACS